MTYKQKKIVSLVLSIIVGIILIKIFFWMLGVAMFVAFTVFKFFLYLFILAVIVGPIYVLFNKKVF
jgi:hypothetical protein